MTESIEIFNDKVYHFMTELFIIFGTKTDEIKNVLNLESLSEYSSVKL